jgi:anhydro-N-acetylmuramic acid kinase
MANANLDAPALYLGLMSGTSVDGIDAALVSFDPLKLHASHSHAFPSEWRALCLALGQGQASVDLDDLGQMDQAIGKAFAEAALTLLKKANKNARDIRAIGSHGQTVRHRPQLPHGFSLQIGCPHRISEVTGISVVADFRRRDVAAGGQGAPLVPAFHAAIFDKNDLVLNLGGISNISVLGEQAYGFDIGPANALLDEHSQRALGQSFDEDGAFARSGCIHEPLLDAMLAHPYFQQSPPKSTGRETFNWAWVESFLAKIAREVSSKDLQATLLELSAKSIGLAVADLPPGALWVCGGGARNRFLIERIAAQTGRHVQSTDAKGIDPDFMEAMAFAWLARETLAQRPGNLPAVTGAAGLRVLGCVVHPTENFD